jgi:P-type E1-E2 ATPase
MNTVNEVTIEQLQDEPSTLLSKVFGQVGLSTLAIAALAVSTILDIGLWPEFVFVLIFVLGTHAFVSRFSRMIYRSENSAELQNLLNSAKNSPSLQENIFKRLSKVWPLVTIAFGVIAFVLSFRLGGNATQAFSNLAAAALITNSGTFSLIVPLAISRVMRGCYDLGLFVQKRSGFEKLASSNLVLFTKRGVLTEAPNEVESIWLAANSRLKDESQILSLAASVESLSSHLLARAVVDTAIARKIKITKAKKFIAVPGYGVQGVVGERRVLIGSPALLVQRNIRMEIQELIYAEESTAQGYSVVCVVVDDVLEGLFRFRDELKPSSAQAVYLIARERIRVGILSGDTAATCQSKASHIAVAEVYSECSRERKLQFLNGQANQGVRVALVSSSEANKELLDKADTSISLSSSPTYIADGLDVLVLGADPELASLAIYASRELRRRTRKSIGFAVSYGLSSLIAFVAIVSPLQVAYAPVLAAMLGSLSVLTVTLIVYPLGKLK